MSKVKTKHTRIVSVPFDNQSAINNILKHGGKFLYFSMDIKYYEVNSSYNL